ncbi:MAG TPA: serine/threonine-protein kinase [Planctomycetaceae bacterium]|nr:serine/threonine-protein kinase [Planctomycetaceae bacterium]
MVHRSAETPARRPDATGGPPAALPPSQEATLSADGGVWATAVLTAGSTLGPYRVLEKLGEGGMGAVYKAVHTKLDKVVAIKVLSTAFTNLPDSVARFEREMKAVGKLEHPNIVRAMDAGEITGTHYLAMEFVEGSNLQQMVRDQGPFPARTAVQSLRDAAVGLQFAHQQGVIHRDIKPGNLMRDLAGRVKVLDLGLARLHSADDVAIDRSQRLTHDGVVMGTIDFMAPEQAADTRDADERSDIYSLGCTLFYLLTGAPPYPLGTVVQRLVAHREAPIPRLTEHRSDLPPALDDLLSQWLAKRPNDRPLSMAVAIQQLDALLQSIELSEKPPVLIATPIRVAPDASRSTATYSPLTAPLALPSGGIGAPPKTAHPLLVGIGLAVLIVGSVLICLLLLLWENEPWGRGMTASSGPLADGAATTGAVNPPKPARKARPLVFDDNGRVDLLRWIDLTSDVDKGEIRFQGRTLSFGSNARLSVRSTGPLPQRVRLLLELSRVAETDGALRLVFQYRETVFGLILDAPADVPGHRTCGINPYPKDGLFQQRDLPRSQPLIPHDRPASVQIDLLETGLRVQLDDELIYEWSGDVNALTGRLPPADFPTLMLDTWADAEQFLIRRAELIDLGPAAASAPATGDTP